MTDAMVIIDQAPLQDRDLLQRLSSYFDGLEHRLRQGQGWFIFNAPAHRAQRIASFIRFRLNDYEPSVNSYVMPWRDFALSAYVKEVGLAELATPNADASASVRAKREFELAVRVTHDTCFRVQNAGLLVLVGLNPRHSHEAIFLDQTIEERYRQRLATILLTPNLPQELEAGYQTVDPTHQYWDRLFHRMYETSLVAL